MLEISIYIIAGGISLIGLVLTVISLPGVWLIFLSTILVAIVDKFQTITPLILTSIFLISLFSTLIDNIVNLLGVKVMGGTIWGMVGAVLGGIVGLIIGNIVGLILGPLLGAFFLEFFLGRRSFEESLKAGLGTFMGVLLSVILKSAINVGIVIFVITRLLP
jgi:uncharacterized protein YqgC (DUF456 family)